MAWAERARRVAMDVRRSTCRLVTISYKPKGKCLFGRYRLEEHVEVGSRMNEVQRTGYRRVNLIIS
jgi:hypothetical protein